MPIANPALRRFFIELSVPTFERLAELAFAERRPVRDQAAVVLEQLLDASNGRVELRQNSFPKLLTATGLNRT
jgi:hypothetical protein